MAVHHNNWLEKIRHDMSFYQIACRIGYPLTDICRTRLCGISSSDAIVSALCEIGDAHRVPGFKHHEAQQTIEELFLVKNRIVDDRATALAGSLEASLAMCFSFRARLMFLKSLTSGISSLQPCHAQSGRVHGYAQCSASEHGACSRHGFGCCARVFEHFGVTQRNKRLTFAALHRECDARQRHLLGCIVYNTGLSVM